MEDINDIMLNISTEDVETALAELNGLEGDFIDGVGDLGFFGFNPRKLMSRANTFAHRLVRSQIRLTQHVEKAILHHKPIPMHRKTVASIVRNIAHVAVPTVGGVIGAVMTGHINHTRVIVKKAARKKYVSLVKHYAKQYSAPVAKKKAKETYRKVYAPAYKHAYTVAKKDIVTHYKHAYKKMKHNPKAIAMIAKIHEQSKEHTGSGRMTVRKRIPVYLDPHSKSYGMRPPTHRTSPQIIPERRPLVHHYAHRPPTHYMPHHRTTSIIDMYPKHVRYALKTINARFRMTHNPHHKAMLKRMAQNVAGRLLLNVVRHPANYNYRYSNLKKSAWVKHAYKTAPKEVRKIVNHELKKAKAEIAKKNQTHAYKKTLEVMEKEGKVSPAQARQMLLRQDMSIYTKEMTPKARHELYLATLKNKEAKLAHQRAVQQLKKRIAEVKKKIAAEQTALGVEKQKTKVSMTKLAEQEKLFHKKLEYWKRRLENDKIKEKAKQQHQIYVMKIKAAKREKARLEHDLKVKQALYIKNLKATIAQLRKERDEIKKELAKTQAEIKKTKIPTHRTPKARKYGDQTITELVKNAIFTYGTDGLETLDDDIESVEL